MVKIKTISQYHGKVQFFGPKSQRLRFDQKCWRRKYHSDVKSGVRSSKIEIQSEESPCSACWIDCKWKWRNWSKVCCLFGYCAPAKDWQMNIKALFQTLTHWLLVNKRTLLVKNFICCNFEAIVDPGLKLRMASVWFSILETCFKVELRVSCMRIHCLMLSNILPEILDCLLTLHLWINCRFKTSFASQLTSAHLYGSDRRKWEEWNVYHC